MASLRSNYIFNLIHSTVGLLFPILTFPYVARIMQADGVGTVQFFQSIINYITLFSALGIPLYAIREIAGVRNDTKKTARATLEILLLHMGLTGIGYVAVFCIAAFAIKEANIYLFLLLSVSLILNALGCDWFYKGIEDFKYITLRGLIVRILSVIFLFLFVRDKDDIFYYALYTLLTTAGNNLFNFIHLRKFIPPDCLKGEKINPLRHLRPALHIFVLNVIISVYVNLDMVMLGFMTDTTVVGYYTAATKLFRISLTLINIIGLVLLPRMSALCRSRKMDEFNRLAQKSMDISICISIPLFLGVIVMAPVLIRLFCGLSYEPAVKTLVILAPALPIIGMSSVMGIQSLYPQGKENLVIISTATGMAANVILNLLLIKSFAQNGAAVASVIAELCVTLMMAVVAKKHLPFNWKSKISQYNVYIIGGIFMFFVCFLIRWMQLNDTLLFTIIPAVGIAIYSSILLLFKDPIALGIIHIIREKVTHRS